MSFLTGASPLGSFRTFWKFSAGTPDLATLNTWGGVIASNWGTNMNPQLHTAITMSQVKLTDLSSSSGAVSITGASQVGTKAGTQLPVDDTVLINYKINRRYRGGKPHSFVPGGIAADVAGGRLWTGAFITAYQSAFQLWLAAVKAGGGNLVISSQVSVPYYHSFIADPHAGTWDPVNVPKLNPNPVPDNIVNATVNPRLGQQRRKLTLGG